jgi:hypothetical protein
MHGSSATHSSPTFCPDVRVAKLALLRRLVRGDDGVVVADRARVEELPGLACPSFPAKPLAGVRLVLLARARTTGKPRDLVVPPLLARVTQVVLLLLPLPELVELACRALVALPEDQEVAPSARQHRAPQAPPDHDDAISYHGRYLTSPRTPTSTRDLKGQLCTYSCFCWCVLGCGHVADSPPPSSTVIFRRLPNFAEVRSPCQSASAARHRRRAPSPSAHRRRAPFAR